MPREQIQGIKFTRQDVGPLVERFERRVDPRQRIYYWLAEINNRRRLEPDTDHAALEAGYISVTPLSYGLTHYRSLDGLEDLDRLPDRLPTLKK